MLNCTLNSA